MATSAFFRRLQGRASGARPCCRFSKEAGQAEQVAKVVPGTIVVGLVDIEIALE